MTVVDVAHPDSKPAAAVIAIIQGVFIYQGNAPQRQCHGEKSRIAHRTFAVGIARRNSIISGIHETPGLGWLIMKGKWIFRVVLGLVLIFMVVIVAVALSLDSIIKRGVEKIGPQATQTQVTLRGAGAKIFSGRLELMGVFVGNPQGYKLPSAITVEDVSVSVKPATVFSPKLVVENITVKEPLITLEGGLKDNNLTKIEKNLERLCRQFLHCAKSPGAKSGGPSRRGQAGAEASGQRPGDHGRES